MSVFGCQTQSPRSCDACPEDELNKIVHVALVKRGTTITTTTAALFTSTLLAAELACNAFVIRNVSGTKAAPTAKEGKGPGKLIKRILAKEHSIEFIDFDYVNNVSFWNDFEINSVNYALYYFTDTYGWVASTTFISTNAKDPISDDNTTFIEGTIGITWTQKGNPLPYKANVDGLATCQNLFTYTSPFINQSSSAATIVGDTITIAHSATLSARYNTSVSALSDVSIISDDQLPTGITLSVSTTYIVLSGSTTETGTYNLTIKAENACGVSTDFDITLIVT